MASSFIRMSLFTRASSPIINTSIHTSTSTSTSTSNNIPLTLRPIIQSSLSLSSPVLLNNNNTINTPRSYRAHTPDRKLTSTGRSVVISGGSQGIIGAYSRLRTILEDDSIRKKVRSRKEFEKPHDKRRRKVREQETRAYMRHMVKQVELAKKLEKKHTSVHSNYTHI